MEKPEFYLGKIAELMYGHRESNAEIISQLLSSHKMAIGSDIDNKTILIGILDIQTRLKRIEEKLGILPEMPQEGPKPGTP